jgi:hypothetical protein
MKRATIVTATRHIVLLGVLSGELDRSILSKTQYFAITTSQAAEYATETGMRNGWR